MNQLLVFSTILSVFVEVSLATQLTFELPDNEKMCFFEKIESGEEATLMFQVLNGGNFDVDFELLAPTKQFLYRDSKKQYDTFTWKVGYGGVHKFCFSNEFSTYTHKIVYFHLQVGEERPVVDNLGGQPEALTLIEASTVSIFATLNRIAVDQTLLRLNEAQGRLFAEDLNEQVFYWSIFESLIVILIGIGQIIILRSFFSNSYKTSIPTIH